MTFIKRILGLDYGEKRIGVAVSDLLKLTAQPLDTIEYKTEEQLWQKLDQLWSAYDFELVVVGMPINMNGSLGFSSQNAREFAGKLADRFHTPVDFWDERLTSYMAEKTLQEMGIKSSRNRGAIDRIAAVLILQGYLDRQRNSSGE